MRKRLCAAVLAMVMTLGILTIPSGAADTTRFSDVSDRSTALAVETLRLMGVLDGYSDGTFRPNQQLTRAQFCKMAVYALGAENELGLYNTDHGCSRMCKALSLGCGVTSIWRPRARRSSPAIRTVVFRSRSNLLPVGQAVTILLRLLATRIDKSAAWWPDS